MPAIATIAPLQYQQADLIEKPQFRVVCLTRVQDLIKIESAWQLLADRAIEPNVFYEPWMLLPAVIRFHVRARLEVYAVYADFNTYSKLVALVPFERQQRRFGIASRSRKLLRYFYCGLCTPLLDAEFGAAAAAELMQALKDGGGVYEFDHVRADGPAMQLMGPALAVSGCLVETRLVARASLRPYASAAAYLDATFKKKKQRNLKKRESQLRQLGRLHYATMNAEATVEAWIDGFLALEASGWKGRAGTAFASKPEHADFFRSICLHAHARGRLEMHALYLDNKPIAYLCLFVAGNELFAFRTAYDEQYSRYAPGVLLAIWHSCAIHERPEVHLVDSCADPDSQLDNEIWLERRYLAAFSVNCSDMPDMPVRLQRGSLSTLFKTTNSVAIEAGQTPAISNREYTEQEAGAESD